MKPFMMRCGACNSEFQFGPHRYDGTPIRAYDMTVCRSCYEANWDGWAPIWEPRIIKQLESPGIPIPARNARGMAFARSQIAAAVPASMSDGMKPHWRDFEERVGAALSSLGWKAELTKASNDFGADVVEV